MGRGWQPLFPQTPGVRPRLACLGREAAQGGPDWTGHDGTGRDATRAAPPHLSIPGRCARPRGPGRSLPKLRWNRPLPAAARPLQAWGTLRYPSPREPPPRSHHPHQTLPAGWEPRRGSGEGGSQGLTEAFVDLCPRITPARRLHCLPHCGCPGGGRYRPLILTPFKPTDRATRMPPLLPPTTPTGLPHRSRGPGPLT